VRRPPARAGAPSLRLRPPTTESEELLTVADIAASLKMNQQTIRNWI
jgi:hypothetical protein